MALYPYWIDLMHNPHANYEEAVQAFKVYWANRSNPAGENAEARDIFGSDKTEKEQETDKNRPVDLGSTFKQFQHWKLCYKNLVKADGTLMTQDEIIEQSNKELKNR
ncbi:MAG: hypothetical protein SGJ00_08595 [bacterium]|nr:hypothetical protein [bacterium]